MIVPRDPSPDVPLLGKWYVSCADLRLIIHEHGPQQACSQLIHRAIHGRRLRELDDVVHASQRGFTVDETTYSRRTERFLPVDLPTLQYAEQQTEWKEHDE